MTIELLTSGRPEEWGAYGGVGGRKDGCSPDGCSPNIKCDPPYPGCKPDCAPSTCPPMWPDDAVFFLKDEN
jgi:hypothetical protein